MKLHIPSPFGAPCEPGRAPDVVSKAVASLPPEQMFQLMQQMKMCIQNNPHEARTMLLQNPQLAYALLQAQVVMKIVDPETAVTMLHKTPAPVPPVGVAGGYGGGGRPGGVMPSSAPPNFGPGFPGGNFGLDLAPGPRMDLHGPDHSGPPRGGMGMPPRGMDPGLPPRLGMDPGRGQYPPEESRGPPRDPRSRDPREGRDPRSMSRGGSSGPGPAAAMRPPPGGGGGAVPQLPPHLAGADPEKAQLIMQVRTNIDACLEISTSRNLILIMVSAIIKTRKSNNEYVFQVLQLTDEQIAVLPAEQRQSIMVLKEQIKQHGPMR